MLNRIQQWFSGGGKAEPAKQAESGYEFKWYEPGSDNPFGVRFLDVRSLTWTVIATTQDRQIAESFNSQRLSDGREFISAKIDDSATVPCNLTFPHQGEPLEGIVFKADSMDVKWDIYIYDSIFLFVRSWNGQLYYRAPAEVLADRITIRSIEAARSMLDTAPQIVRFLMASHAMGRVLPHPIPAETPDDPMAIAVTSFSMFGKLACYATYEDMTGVEIPPPSPSE